MLLVYTHKVTPRLNFVFKQIFVRILKVPISFTTEINNFIAHSGPKITYSRKPLGNELFIKSNELLFEQGVNDIEIKIHKWNDFPVFFFNSAKGVVPFDMFAASFYLLSRYEEYLPHVQDENERFPASESLAYKNDFLSIPLVDVWAMKLRDVLIEKFPDYDFPTRAYNEISTIDVDAVFSYKHKGFVRNFGGLIKDVFTFKLDRIIERSMVLLRLKKDPFDTFDYILDVSKRNKVKTIFFFLIGDYTTYDKNVSSSNSSFRSLIKSVSDYVDVSLHPSYFTMKNSLKLAKEKRKMEQILNRPVTKTRQHYLRLKLPETYQNLIDLEVQEDHTMGYAKEYGFRASTCTPFYFYDLDFEIQTPLKIFPFTFMDTTFRAHLKLIPTIAKSKIEILRNNVKDVNGTFISLFHNESLSENKVWKGWKDVYSFLYDNNLEK